VDAIDVSGLPEPLAQAIQKMIETLRAQFPRNGQPAATPTPGRVALPVWPGKVIGSLSREDIYGDAL